MDTTSATIEQTHITVDLSAGTGLAPAKPGQYYGSVPQESGTAVAVNGRGAKLLLATYRFGKQHLVYSTSQLMTNGAAAEGYRRVFDLHLAKETDVRVPAGWIVAKDPTVEFLQIAPGQAVSYRRGAQRTEKSLSSWIFQRRISSIEQRLG